MSKVRLNVLGISYSQTQTGAYALVLNEEDGDRRIPIIIGGFEAQSIAIQLEGLKPPRPLTHDLFLNFATAFGIFLMEVFIYKLEEGVFYSKLICKGQGDNIEIDSRTSDAIALAIRFRCPISTTEEIMEKSGITMENENTEEDLPVLKKKKKKDLKGQSIEKLEEMLNEAIRNEDYERASRLRDEIKTKKQE